ncbi:hypothetical protein [Actinomadura latina]|uniref:Uncharacterized protein n=1 Tax=Actinomadura latina TaxID=163603 RepID=A0A846YUP3_9ACTN|nr:hypothetical protein [Actinomadura latina]NKZ03821.1 hypothetical protein [Actinomadura latina]
MTERTPGESADEGMREPEEQVSGAPATGVEHTEEEFRPDSPEGRGGRMEDLSPDDFE